MNMFANSNDCFRPFFSHYSNWCRPVCAFCGRSCVLALPENEAIARGVGTRMGVWPEAGDGHMPAHRAHPEHHALARH
jgi:hypothetical protein